DTLGRELWDSAPERESFGRAGLWRLRWDKTRGRLRDLLGLEAQASDRAKVLAVSGVEQGVDATIELRDGLLHFNGKIDRLDDADDTAIVVDYKTGRPISRKDVDAAQKLQLQLYSKAIMEQEPRFTRAVARFAYLRPTGTKERFELDTGRAEDRETVDAALERVAVIRERTREGHFEVTPEPFKEEGTSRRCLSYCDLKYICRGMPFGRWKQWDA
ncbi:MAG: RecB family exonuclease, partial [Dehalococcoidia bacterium]